MVGNPIASLKAKASWIRKILKKIEPVVLDFAFFERCLRVLLAVSVVSFLGAGLQVAWAIESKECRDMAERFVMFAFEGDKNTVADRVNKAQSMMDPDMIQIFKTLYWNESVKGIAKGEQRFMTIDGIAAENGKDFCKVVVDGRRFVRDNIPKDGREDLGLPCTIQLKITKKKGNPEIVEILYHDGTERWKAVGTGN